MLRLALPPSVRSASRLLVLLAGALLCLDALLLMSIGMRHLGVLLPLPIGLALIGLAWRGAQWQHWLAQQRWRQRLWRAVCIGFWLWLASLLLFFLQIAQAGQERPDLSAAPPGAILVLGSGTNHCRPSPTLRRRLERGLDLARAYPQARVVVSGGVDPGFGCTEAEVMRRYLRGQGLDEARLLLEERSTSTHENLVFSRTLLEQAGLDPRHTAIMVITSDFHVPRSLRIARQAGYAQVRAAGAPTPRHLRWNAWLREYFAFASSRALGEF